MAVFADGVGGGGGMEPILTTVFSYNNHVIMFHHSSHMISLLYVNYLPLASGTMRSSLKSKNPIYYVMQ